MHCRYSKHKWYLIQFYSLYMNCDVDVLLLILLCYSMITLLEIYFVFVQMFISFMYISTILICFYKHSVVDSFKIS